MMLHYDVCNNDDGDVDGDDDEVWNYLVESLVNYCSLVFLIACSICDIPTFVCPLFLAFNFRLTSY